MSHKLYQVLFLLRLSGLSFDGNNTFFVEQGGASLMARLKTYSIQAVQVLVSDGDVLVWILNCI